MRIKPLEFQTARNLDHALSLLKESRKKAKILAGGTDLVLNLKKKRVDTDTMISLHGVAGLDRVEEKNGFICIGAMSKHEDLARHPVLKEKIDILCQAVGLIGSWQIRNAGTIGGNVCNASPAGDSLPPLLVLNAELVMAEPDRESIMPVASFFTGPGQTRLKPGQILKEIRIPLPPENSAGCYMKLRRRTAVDISLAGVAFQAHTDAAGKMIEQVGIALGGVAPTPIRVPEAEAMFTGIPIEEAFDKVKACAGVCAATAQPIDDLRATADYKRTIVKIFAQRCAHHVLTTLKTSRG